jgi:hypothetical protein
MRPFRLLAPALLLVTAAAIAACASGGGASPSAASSTEPSAAPSSAAPASASAAASPSASASASAGASASAAGTRVDVVGTDYAYSGLQPTYDGPISIAFRNEGEEVHEIVLVRKNPGVTESFQELLALPDAESATKVAFVGVAFAEPGQTAAEMVVADQPGEYLAVCFIPQGTTELPSIDPNASAPPSLGTGAPHFTLGMLQEFTIGS